MANDFYQDSGNPATGSSGSSALIRAEFASVEAGFDKLPTLSTNGGKLVKINAGGTAMEAADDTNTFMGITQNSQSAAYTCVAADANKHILHPTADNNARTFTIPANASVAYAIGTTITFVNQINTVTLAITSDTMTMAGTGLTGSRTLSANGMATALKVSSTGWVIAGTGLT